MSCIKCDSINDPNCLQNPENTNTCYSTNDECFLFVEHHTRFVLRGCVNTTSEPDDFPCCYVKCSAWSYCNNRKIDLIQPANDDDKV